MKFFKNKFTKDGPGVEKNEKKKHPFFHFFVLYGRNFWKIITVNMLFVLFSIPIITIGPALAGMMHVLRNLSSEKQSFVASDFFEHFKKNLKQGIPAGIITLVGGSILFFSNIFYLNNLEQSALSFILSAFIIFSDIIFIFSHFYIYLMIVTLDLKLKEIYKNALFFSFLGIKSNFLCLISMAIFLFITFYYIFAGLLLFIFIIPASIGFLVAFNCFPIIKKYSIDPYYDKSKTEE